MTRRRRVRWPDWPRERRHAQKGRGTRKGGGAERDGKARVGELRQWSLFVVVGEETEPERVVVRVVVVRVCSKENKKARVDADRSVKRERVESGRAAARVRVRDRRRRE